MANRSVVLYLRTKIKKKWAYRKVAEVISKLACGEYYLSWNDGKRKRLDPAGSDPEAALAALSRKSAWNSRTWQPAARSNSPTTKRASNWPIWRRW